MLVRHCDLFVPTEISLTPQQIAVAVEEANRRQSVNEARRLKGRNKAPASGDKALEMHVLGCIGEVAAASFFGLEEHLFKNKSAIKGSSDLPYWIEVKTRKNHSYDLLVQLDDSPLKRFVLVTHDGSATMIHGWIDGYLAIQRKYIREFVRGRPCYAVPQSDLRPLEDLSLMIQSGAATNGLPLVVSFESVAEQPSAHDPSVLVLPREHHDSGVARIKELIEDLLTRFPGGA